jgi:hypothetical protein
MQPSAGPSPTLAQRLLLRGLHRMIASLVAAGHLERLEAEVLGERVPCVRMLRRVDTPKHAAAPAARPRPAIAAGTARLRTNVTVEAQLYELVRQAGVRGVTVKVCVRLTAARRAAPDGVLTCSAKHGWAPRRWR